MSTFGRIVSSLPKRAHVDYNWPISREKYLKIDWSVQNAVALGYCGSCRLLVMSSWLERLFLPARLFLCARLFFPGATFLAGATFFAGTTFFR